MGVGGTQLTTYTVPTIRPIFDSKPISSSKGSTIRNNSKRKEPKRVDGCRLNQKRPEITPANKPMHLPTSHPDAKQPNCQRKPAGTRILGKKRFCKLQREQNLTNETTNATNSTKLDGNRRQRLTSKTTLHGSHTNPRPHCIPHLNLVTKETQGCAQQRRPRGPGCPPRDKQGRRQKIQSPVGARGPSGHLI